jgi:hypothetical protein
MFVLQSKPTVLVAWRRICVFGELKFVTTEIEVSAKVERVVTMRNRTESECGWGKQSLCMWTCIKERGLHASAMR